MNLISFLCQQRIKILDENKIHFSHMDMERMTLSAVEQLLSACKNFWKELALQ